MKTVLILGGTGEAVALARALEAEFGEGLAVISSLAGRTKTPVRPVGTVRKGGFGGVAGLTDYLRAQSIDAVIDATHPFAARMTANAVAACRAAGVPRLRIDRPAWTPVDGDRWRKVPDIAAAAAALPGLGSRVFLTVGSQELDAFKGLAGLRFWARMIEPPPPGELPDGFTVIEARGPFDEKAEAALMRKHGVDVLVTKNSGGAAAAAKLAAARMLGIPVVMVARPPAPAGDRVPGVVEAVDWLRLLVR